MNDHCLDCIFGGWVPGEDGIERCDVCRVWRNDAEAEAHVSNIVRTLIANYGEEGLLDLGEAIHTND